MVLNDEQYKMLEWACGVYLEPEKDIELLRTAGALQARGCIKVSKTPDFFPDRMLVEVTPEGRRMFKQEAAYRRDRAAHKEAMATLKEVEAKLYSLGWKLTWEVQSFCLPAGPGAQIRLPSTRGREGNTRPSVSSVNPATDPPGTT